MKRQVLIGLAIFGLFLCITTAPASAQISDKGKCRELFYDWSGAGNSFGSVYVWIDANGYWESSSGGIGAWRTYGGSFSVNYETGCRPLYSGSKKQGFFNCQDGTGSLSPGIWYLKGTKKINCGFLYTAVTSQDEGVSSDAQPPR